MSRVALKFRHHFTNSARATRVGHYPYRRIQGCFICNIPFRKATVFNAPTIPEKKACELLWAQSRHIVTEPPEEEGEEATDNQKQGHSPPLKVSATYMARSVDVVKLQQLIFQTW